MKTVVTHNGNFHTDDIFAVATLKIVYKDIKIIRSRDKAVIDSADIVVDTGGVYDQEKLRFDHHQSEGAGKHDSGIPYASFGLVWKEYGADITGSIEAAKIIETKLVTPIDAIDNGIDLATYHFPGIREYSFADYMYSLVDRDSSDSEDLYAMFIKLVGVAEGALLRVIDKVKNVVEDAEKVRNIAAQSENKHIIVLPEPLSWRYAVQDLPEVLYVVYPKKEGGWGVKAPRVSEHSFESRKPMPESWITDTREDFIKATGVPDALFMHKARWYAAADSLEGALELAQKALNA